MQTGQICQKQKWCNGFRSVDVLLVFRFGGSPSGQPVVENMNPYRFYNLFVDATGVLLGGSLGHAVAASGAHWRGIQCLRLMETSCPWPAPIFNVS